MPKSKGTSGGQRRTITFPCDKSVQGHPDRLNTIIRLHHKKCEVCQSTQSKPFNSHSVEFEADLNGTEFAGGVRYDPQRPALCRRVDTETGASDLIAQSGCLVAGDTPFEVSASAPAIEMPTNIAKKRKKKKKNKKRFG